MGCCVSRDAAAEPQKPNHVDQESAEVRRARSAEAAQARAQAAAKRGLPNGGPSPANATSGAGLPPTSSVVEDWRN